MKNKSGEITDGNEPPSHPHPPAAWPRSRAPAEPAALGAGRGAGGSAGTPRRPSPDGSAPRRGRFPRGFLVAGREAGLLGGLLLWWWWCCWCRCRAFVLRPSRRIVERGLQMGIVFATVWGTVL